MNNKNMIDNRLIIIALVIFAVLSRFVPHPVNFTPVGGLGLLAGAFFVDRRFWLIPLIALLASDIVIGFYHPLAMIFVYAGFFCSALIGRVVLKNTQNISRIGASAVLSASLFFILSNFGTWLTGLLYPVTISGLIECYIAAVPFYGNTLAGDVIYSFGLFGLYYLLQQTQISRNANTV